MALEITFVGVEKLPLMSSLPPLNLRQELEENVFDNNFKCEDCECDSAYS